jgi:hypothetical protein
MPVDDNGTLDVVSFLKAREDIGAVSPPAVTAHGIMFSHCFVIVTLRCRRSYFSV